MAEHTAVSTLVQVRAANIHAICGSVESLEMDKPVNLSNLKVQEKTGKSRFLALDIGGTQFRISKALVNQNPGSRLASPTLMAEHWCEELDAYYFDRDPMLFNSILNCYRYGICSPPAKYSKLFQDELKFWKMPIEKLHTVHDEDWERIEKQFDRMTKRLVPVEKPQSSFHKNRFALWCFLADPSGPDTKYKRAAVAFAGFTIAIIFTFLVGLGMSTSLQFRDKISLHKLEINHEKDGKDTLSVNAAEDNHNNQLPGSREGKTDQSSSAEPSGSAITEEAACGETKLDCHLHSSTVTWLMYFLYVCSTYFVLITILRLVSCPNLRQYFLSVINWIDLLSSIGLIMLLLLESSLLRPNSPSKAYGYARVLLEGFQVFRVFKIFQYTTLVDGLLVMELTLRASLRELLIMLLYMTIAALLFSTLMIFVEMAFSPAKGIPDGLVGYWWAVITMTTVGYGDFYPETTLGYIVGGACAVSGLLMTALPVAVIGNNFHVYWEHNRQRKLIAKQNQRKDAFNEY